MKATIHRVTTKQFARALMKECRRRRKLDLAHDGSIRVTQRTLSYLSGYNSVQVNLWEQGRRDPSLRQALDCLQALAA